MIGASASASGKFLLKIEKRTLKSVELVEADYLLIASGSSQQVWINGWIVINMLIVKP